MFFHYVPYTSHWLAQCAPHTQCTDLLPSLMFFKREGNKIQSIGSTQTYYTVLLAQATLSSDKKGKITPHRGNTPSQASLRENLSGDISRAFPSTRKAFVKAALMKSLILSSVSTVQLQPSKPILWAVFLTQHEGLSAMCKDEIENL